MPLTLPNLDDRTYTDLVDEALALIPTYAPDEWTNHNPSDPGIMLIEMFAFLTEMLIYRLNQIPEANIVAFLKLINGPNWTRSEQTSLKQEIREAVLKLRERNRAVTCEDYEMLAIAAAPDKIARAHCVPGRNLESGMERPSSVSVIIVPKSEESAPQPDDSLRQTVKAYLEPKRLLTTRIHAVGPSYVPVGVRLRLYLQPDALIEEARQRVMQALKQYFHPLRGGPQQNGWPFGRYVYVSEVYHLLDTLPGVDYVDRTIDADTGPLDELIAEEDRLQRNAQGELAAVEIRANELVEAQIDANELTLVSPIYDLTGEQEL